VKFHSALRVAALAATTLASATVALGQGTGRIDGKVVDEGGRPIVGARVEITPTARRILSDEDGSFRFLNVAVGRYAIATQRIGYKSSKLAVDVTALGTKTTIVLVAIPQILDSIRIHEHAFPMRYSAVVVDGAGRPIPDVSVVVAGIDNTIRTDSAGHFVVSKNVHGRLIVRMRKIGYGAYLGSLTMLTEREDTLRMSRLAQGLSAVQITEASGFGRDTFVYKDLDQRMRWRTHMSTVMSREDLDRLGRGSLCPSCGDARQPCVILNGERGTAMPLSAFFADQVEAVEVYPPKSDWSGNLAARGCSGVLTWVVWLRKDTARAP
jgi:hypothetical protein